jgi:hypothetical protein
MFRLLLSSLMGLALLCQPALTQKKEEPKKDAVKKDEPKGQTVKVKSVDEKTGTLVVTTTDGKTMTFKVDMDVKIVGPLGGVSKERLKVDVERVSGPRTRAAHTDRSFDTISLSPISSALGRNR